jgi:hypothetical protein
MLYSGQDAAVRTDIVLPSPGWSRTLNLGSAINTSVTRGETSVWQGQIPLDSTHLLNYRQTVTEADGRLHFAIEYTALQDLAAEGLFFRINIPWDDFHGGTAVVGPRTVTLPESLPANNNLAYAETSLIAASGASSALAWWASFSRPFGINLQDKSTESPKSYTYWVYIVRGSLAAGMRGSFEVDLTIAGMPDSSTASLTLDASLSRYRFQGFGGNYCFNINSPVADYTLANLTPRWARTEMLLTDWEPSNDNSSPYDTAWAALAARDLPGSNLRRAFEMMRRLNDRGIPYVSSVWRLPEWLLGDRDKKGPSDQQRRIDPALWDELLESIGSYLVYARDTYGAEPAYFSFNEPEIGVRILFSADEHRDAIRRIGAHFESLGLKTKLLLGDVSNPRTTISYTQPAANDAEAMRYVGAVSFHSWGGATPAQYAAWGDLAESLGLPLLVAELGTDASAYNGASYDSYWYGIDETRMYQELILYARPQGTMYWEFTSDYSLVRTTKDGITPTGRFWLTKHFTDLTPPQSEVLSTSSDHPKVLVTAFRDGGRHVLHIANLSAARDAVLTGLPEGVTEWQAVQTTEADGFATLSPVPAASGGLRLNLPARSLLTLTGDLPVGH